MLLPPPDEIEHPFDLRLERGDIVAVGKEPRDLEQRIRLLNAAERDRSGDAVARSAN